MCTALTNEWNNNGSNYVVFLTSLRKKWSSYESQVYVLGYRESASRKTQQWPKKKNCMIMSIAMSKSILYKLHWFTKQVICALGSILNIGNKRDRNLHFHWILVHSKIKVFHKLERRNLFNLIKYFWPNIHNRYYNLRSVHAKFQNKSLTICFFYWTL